MKRSSSSASVLVADNVETQMALFRFSMCRTCGMSLHAFSIDANERAVRLEPRTVPGLVRLGRCLLCHPVRSLPSTMAPSKTHRRPKRCRISAQDDAEEKETACGIVNEPDEKMSLTISICDSKGKVFTGVLTEGSERQGSGTFTRVVQGRHVFVSTYEGEFKNGLFHGSGTLCDAWGSTYVGGFRKGARHGHGRTYNGECPIDLRQGRTKGSRCLIQCAGNEYIGEWKNDSWHGNGTLKFASGGHYKGAFYRGRVHGQGRYEYADGSVYEGTFRYDLRCGMGTMVYSDGVRYVGEWKGNNRHGKGTLFYTDNSSFKGTWRDDEKHGVGLFCMPDGILRRQRWVNGRQLESDDEGNR